MKTKRMTIPIGAAGVSILFVLLFAGAVQAEDPYRLPMGEVMEVKVDEDPVDPYDEGTTVIGPPPHMKRDGPIAGDVIRKPISNLKTREEQQQMRSIHDYLNQRERLRLLR